MSFLFLGGGPVVGLFVSKDCLGMSLALLICCLIMLCEYPLARNMSVSFASSFFRLWSLDMMRL